MAALLWLAAMESTSYTQHCSGEIRLLEMDWSLRGRQILQFLLSESPQPKLRHSRAFKYANMIDLWREPMNLIRYTWPW